MAHVKPPELGDRVRFSVQDNEVVEGVVKRDAGLGRLYVCGDDGRDWLVGGGDVLVVEP